MEYKALEIKKKVYFTENSIVYGQDFTRKQGIKPYVFFDVVDKGIFNNEDDVWLRAPGFGEDPYGNGSIVVTKKDLDQDCVKWVE